MTRSVAEIFHAPVVLVMMEAPVALPLLILPSAQSWGGLRRGRRTANICWLDQQAQHPAAFTANRSAITAQQYADGGVMPKSLSPWHATRHPSSLDQKSNVSLRFQGEKHRDAGYYQAVSKFCKTRSAPCC
jgi:hypothetical protein